MTPPLQTREVGRQKLRRQNDVLEDITNIKIRNWWKLSGDREVLEKYSGESQGT